MKIYCFNVNGLRAIEKKGFLDMLKKEQPDIICLQEIKSLKEQLPSSLIDPLGYNSYFYSAQKKGYSVVAIYTKLKPKEVVFGLGKDEYDSEGRTITIHFEEFALVNVYVPNGGVGNKRVPYKMAFSDLMLDYLQKLRAKKNVVVCGDFNTAHEEIDIARPKDNAKKTGFLQEERDWLTMFISKGYVDTFRELNPKAIEYSYWDMKTRARERNVGWRIDYFFINKEFLPKLKKAYIKTDLMGSDHCPIGVDIELK